MARARVPAPSSQLQRREAEQREDDREDHEARDHLRLAPADQLEVVVERRHAEQPLSARRLEVADLQDDGERLEEEDAADDRQEQLLLDQDRDEPERGAERERAAVAHENLGGGRGLPQGTAA